MSSLAQYPYSGGIRPPPPTCTILFVIMQHDYIVAYRCNPPLPNMEDILYHHATWHTSPPPPPPPNANYIMSAYNIIMSACNIIMSTCNIIMSTCDIIMLSTCEMIILAYDLNYLLHTYHTSHGQNHSSLPAC